MSTSDSPSGLIAFVAIAALALWFGLRDSDWLAKEHATSQYGVPDSKIQVVGKRPHDCDFLTAPIGSKHCSYEREYRAGWFALSATNQPIVYGTIQESPPTACSSEYTDFAHICYPIDDLGPDEHPTAAWRARSVEIHWRKVEE